MMERRRERRFCIFVACLRLMQDDGIGMGWMDVGMEERGKRGYGLFF